MDDIDHPLTHGTKQASVQQQSKLTVPLFLRKAYDMINTCDPTLADWSDDGTTFVIKEPELFASQIIPSYFKHANLSSFVRQLNFYGFRKIKSDPLRLLEPAGGEGESTSRHWKFGHRFFVQGRQDLLSYIKRTKDNANSSSYTTYKEDVEEMKQQNNDIKRKLSSLTQDVQELKATLAALTPTTESANKKQRRQFARNADPDFAPSVQEILDPEDDCCTRMESLDPDLLLLLVDKNDDSKNNNDTRKVNATAHAATLPHETWSSAAVPDLLDSKEDAVRQSLCQLPLDLQTLLVDRLVERICCQNHPPDDTQQPRSEAVIDALSSSTPVSPVPNLAVAPLSLGNKMKTNNNNKKKVNNPDTDSIMLYPCCDPIVCHALLHAERADKTPMSVTSTTTTTTHSIEPIESMSKLIRVGSMSLFDCDA